ncbi:hypothetical protein V8C86DRAFT_1008661 [Haematococcus lacustris]
MTALLADAEAAGAVLALRSRVVAGWVVGRQQQGRCQQQGQQGQGVRAHQGPPAVTTLASSGNTLGRPPGVSAGSQSVQWQDTPAAMALPHPPTLSSPPPRAQQQPAPTPGPGPALDPGGRQLESEGVGLGSRAGSAAAEAVAGARQGGGLVLMEGGAAAQGVVVEVEDAGSGQRSTLVARQLVNAAGLEAQHLAACIRGIPAASIPPRYLARGVYFGLAASAGKPFSRLIYPLPPAAGAGLGTHLTLDLAGCVRFGPDVEWVDKVEYTVDPGRAASFYQAIRAYWPGLPDDSLVPAYAGVRPKVSGPGQPPADFMIQSQREHGVPGVVCLYGIESPGLTASLAVANMVCSLLRDEDTRLT